MRVLILTPTALPSVTGNAITAERWRRLLVSKGLYVKVLPVGQISASSLREEIDRFRPDLLHSHHALHSGRLLLDPEVSGRYGSIPVVVSPAGTDINGDLEDQEKREIVFGICHYSRAIIAQGRGIRERMERLLPGLGGKVVHVPKSVMWFGESVFDLRSACGWSREDFVFFMPAGIRSVKGNLECLRALEALHSVRPKTRAVFAGPVLDVDYARRFEEEIKRLRAFACWIQEIPPEAMRSAYGGADVVLNASRAEGLSNVLLEAIASGRPVLASDIPGNRWMILGDNGGPCGCLFEPGNTGDFVRQALRLIDDGQLRERLVKAGLAMAGKWPDPRTEADRLIETYRKAVGLS
ncbi:MAG: glycosyltransferase family 4 protein [Deltaproteobacteria bacterium]|nr:glycosyltransferase family 4 protein [Deltaproteobacteria bacterium]